MGAAGDLIITPFGKSKKADSEKTNELKSSLVLHSIVSKKNVGVIELYLKLLVLPWTVQVIARRKNVRKNFLKQTSASEQI